MNIGEGFSGKYQEPDPLQAKLADPAHMANALYQGERFVVMADDLPVAPNHVLVISREAVPLEKLTFADQQALWALAMVTQAHMTRVLHPARKVSISVWGNQVRTAHLHLVPRVNPSDATNWQRQQFESEGTRLAQLTETYALLKFPEDAQAAADLAVHEALKRNSGLVIPQLASAPGALAIGENQQ
jgi:diadenosine tetraphosphate (Ap4A) HIT family hydrolase